MKYQPTVLIIIINNGHLRDFPFLGLHDKPFLGHLGGEKKGKRVYFQ